MLDNYAFSQCRISLHSCNHCQDLPYMVNHVRQCLRLFRDTAITIMVNVLPWTDLGESFNSVSKPQLFSGTLFPCVLAFSRILSTPKRDGPHVLLLGSLGSFLDWPQSTKRRGGRLSAIQRCRLFPTAVGPAQTACITQTRACLLQAMFPRSRRQTSMAYYCLS